MVNIHQYFMRQKCSPKHPVFSGILFIAIFTEVTENECVTENQGQIRYRNNHLHLNTQPCFRIHGASFPY